MKLQSRCQLEVQSSEGLTWLKDSFPRGLIYVPAKLILVIGRRPQLHAMWTSS